MATSGTANSSTTIGGSWVSVTWDRTGTGTNSSTIRVRLFLHTRGGATFTATETGYVRNQANQSYNNGNVHRPPGDYNHLVHTYTRTLNHDSNGNLTLSWGGQYVSGWSGFGTLTISNRNSTVDRRPLAPTNNAPTWSNVGSTTATVAGSVSSNGHGSSSTIYLRYRQSGTPTWTELSSGTPKNLTGLTSNARHYVSSRATNNNGDANSWTTGTYDTITLPLSCVAGTPVVEATTATIPVTQNNGGGVYSITRQYRLQRVGEGWGSWTTFTGNISLSDLRPSTDYNLQLRSTTSAGTTTGATTAFTTLPAAKLIQPDGTVINAIPRLVKPDGTVVDVKLTRIDP